MPARLGSDLHPAAEAPGSGTHYGCCYEETTGPRSFLGMRYLEDLPPNGEPEFDFDTFGVVL